MPMLTEKRIKALIIIWLILFISGFHYFINLRFYIFHVIIERFYYIPIVLSGFWFGLKGGLLTSFSVSLFYMPHIVWQWQVTPLTDVERYLELFLFNIIAAIVGGLSEKEKRAVERYRQIGFKLEESYKELQLKTDALQEKEEELRRSEKLAVLGELAAGVSHEIKTPLASIKGAAEIITSENTPKNRVKEFSQILVSEVNRLSRFLETVLRFARVREPHKLKVNLEKIVDEVILLIGHQAKKSSIRIVKEVKLDSAYALIDADQIRQLILNLIVNAVQSMEEQGGTIVIKMENDGSSLIIAVKDSGKGIKKSDIDNIFKPFFTTKESGAGLGLAICRRIVEAHKGEITVSSEEEIGSIFTVILPAGEINEKET